MMSLCSILLCTILAGQAGAPPQTPPPDPAAQVDRIFERWDRTVSPGCAVAVMKDGRIVYKRGFGMADLDHDVTITPATVFHVASMSKQFTAAAILLLEQDGRLSVDDDVRRAMGKEGFEVYPDEWWHFDYKDWKHYRILDTPFKDIPAQTRKN